MKGAFHSFHNEDTEVERLFPNTDSGLTLPSFPSPKRTFPC